MKMKEIGPRAGAPRGYANVYICRQAEGWHSTEMPSCYRPQTKFGQGNVFTPVCLSTGGVL